MRVGSVHEDTITCLTNHLSSFSMVILPRTDKVERSQILSERLDSVVNHYLLSYI